MPTETSGTVVCALCGAENPGTAGECHACGGQLPGARRGWNQPAFERVLLAASRASAEAPSSKGRRCGSRRLPGAWDWLRASGETISAVLLRPDRTFRSFRLEGGFAPPIAFVSAVGGAALFLHVFVSPRYSVMETLRWWHIPIFPLAPVVYVYLRAQVVHLVLVCTGRAKERFEVTFRVVAYGSAAASLFLIVPAVGDFLFLATGVWIESNGLRRCHRISLEAALGAEVIPAGVLILTVLAAATMHVLWWSQVAG